MGKYRRSERAGSNQKPNTRTVCVQILPQMLRLGNAFCTIVYRGRIVLASELIDLITSSINATA